MYVCIYLYSEFIYKKKGTFLNINFDTSIDSVIAVFMFILNEEWHVTMYDYMRSTNYNAGFFWIFMIITGVSFFLI